MISYVIMLVLIIMSFCIICIVLLGMMIGLLLSSWRRFFVSGMMILEYSLVMAEVVNVRTELLSCHTVICYVEPFLIFNLFVLYFEYDFT